MKTKRPRIYVKRPVYTTVQNNTNVNKDENRNLQRDRNSARS